MEDLYTSNDCKSTRFIFYPPYESWPFPQIPSHPPPNLEVYQAQLKSSSMLDGDQDQAKPISKMLQDFIDGNRNLHDVTKEIIEETDDLTIEDFLSDLINVLTDCQQSEVQSRLLKAF